MIKVCVDVDYRAEEAMAAAVLFRNWDDDIPAGEVVQRVVGIEPYVPGAFYRRELPCLLAVLADVPEPVELVVIDGYVWVGDESQPGLGARLHQALGGQVPVIGVAKTQFTSARVAQPVLRGTQARKPLFVSTVGIDIRQACDAIRAMHGPHRLPTLLKRVDRLCRDG